MVSFKILIYSDLSLTSDVSPSIYLHYFLICYYSDSNLSFISWNSCSLVALNWSWAYVYLSNLIFQSLSSCSNCSLASSNASDSSDFFYRRDCDRLMLDCCISERAYSKDSTYSCSSIIASSRSLTSSSLSLCSSLKFVFNYSIFLDLSWFSSKTCSNLAS